MTPWARGAGMRRQNDFEIFPDSLSPTWAKKGKSNNRGTRFGREATWPATRTPMQEFRDSSGIFSTPPTCRW
jgi:hypothetical protein